VHEGTVDYHRKWYVMAAVGMGVLLSTIDGSIVNVALPTLSRVFEAEFATVQWVVLSYLLTVTTLTMSIGRLGDILGKKSIYALGFILFTFGSTLCGLAPSIYGLIAFRIFQAIGAAMLVALGMAIVTEAFPSSERGRALGISGSLVSIGIVIGPVLGGLIVDALSWRWIFYVNLPVGILGILMVRKFVPDVKPAGGQEFDYQGAVSLFVSILALLLALTFSQEIGFRHPLILFLFACCLLFLVLFVLIEWKSDHPMVNLELFRNNLFSIGLFSGFFTFVSIAGTTLLMPFYIENVLGYEPHIVGLLMATVPIALGLTAPLSGSLSDKLGTRPVTIVGLFALCVGYYATRTLTTQSTPLDYVLRFLPVGIGMGVFQSPNNSAIMGSVSSQRLGIASGMLAITRSLGQTVGIAVLGAVWVNRIKFYSGETSPLGMMSASAESQVAGLQDTLTFITILMSITFLSALWGPVQNHLFRRCRKLKTMTSKD
jgi:EmrB/QacA subfamily drug resistance transporter